MAARVILKPVFWGVFLSISLTKLDAQTNILLDKAAVFTNQTNGLPDCQPAINTSFSPSLIEEHRVQFLPDTLNPYLDYYWDFGDGYVSYEINPAHTYWNNGLYQVCLTITDTSLDCSSSFCTEMQLNTTSIEEGFALKGGVRIGPNPLQGALNIFWDHSPETWEAQVFSISGQMVARFESSQSAYAWNGARLLAPGAYLIRIQNGGQIESKLLIKQ